MTKSESAHQRITQREDRIRAMTPEELAIEWNKQCERYDNATARGETLNSSAMESANGWMNFIQREFVERGLNIMDYTQAQEAA